eukprot:1143801-Prymnesium_polylepis.1
MLKSLTGGSYNIDRVTAGHWNENTSRCECTFPARASSARTCPARANHRGREGVNPTPSRAPVSAGDYKTCARARRPPPALGLSPEPHGTF